MTNVLIYIKGKFGHRQPHREGRQCEETQREDSFVISIQAKEYQGLSANTKR